MEGWADGLLGRSGNDGIASGAVKSLVRVSAPLKLFQALL